MQEHPIPRQITTFEFKLIGELTIHQFVYLAFGSVIALILFFAVPSILYLNFVAAALPALLGVGFAFVPVNDRPMDIWLKNLVRRLTSPTQYYFKKNNLPPKILLGITLPPREILQQHILAQQKLNAYLQSKPKVTAKDSENVIDSDLDQRKRKLQAMMMQAPVMGRESRVAGLESAGTVQPSPSVASPSVAQPVPPTAVTPAPVPAAVPVAAPVSPPAPSPIPAHPDHEPSNVSVKSFVVRGEVYASSGVPLPNILAYVKQDAKIVRLFKTDANGVFASNLPIPLGEYVLTLEDPRKKYTFDTMKIDGTLPNIVVFAHKNA